MTDKPLPFQDEIEAMLVNHTSTRFGEVARAMKRGLTDAEMAEEAR